MPSNLPYASTVSAASGLIIPRSNGYTNRLIRDQIGAGTVTLPSSSRVARLALLDAAGSGAVAVQDASTNFHAVSAGGGAPLILATLDLDVVGRTFSYVLGAGGDSVSLTGQGGLPGLAGALSSVVWGPRTLTANPGQGGKVSNANTGASALALVPGGLGGTGTGGDFNFSGGPGGAFAQRDGSAKGVLPGGGTSGRPNGDGLRGSQFAGLYDKSVIACLPGSSWGFVGDVDPNSISSTFDGSSYAGPGVYGVGNFSRPGAGEGALNLKGPFTSGDILATPGASWWDITDIAGWGGAILSDSNGGALSLLAGPGGAGAGSGRALVQGNLELRIDALDGGFGAGGGAGRTRFNTSNNPGGRAFGGNGGRGGGGAPAVGYWYSNANSYLPAQSGRGGDSWLGVWFN